MANLAALPAEILIQICQYLDLESVFNLRLTHPRLAAIVLKQGVHIAPSVAHNIPCYPEVSRLLHIRNSKSYDFDWLRRIPVKISASLTSGTMEYWRGPRGANQDCSEMRTYISGIEAVAQDGWRVINSLGIICRRYIHQVERAKEEDGSKVSWKRRSYEHFNAISQLLPGRGEVLAAEFKRYLDNLPNRRLENYKTTIRQILESLYICWHAKSEKRIYAHEYTIWNNCRRCKESYQLLAAVPSAKVHWNHRGQYIEPLPIFDKTLAMVVIYHGALSLFGRYENFTYNFQRTTQQTLQFMDTQWTGQRKRQFLAALKTIEKIMKSKEIGKST